MHIVFGCHCHKPGLSRRQEAAADARLGVSLRLPWWLCEISNYIVVWHVSDDHETMVWWTGSVKERRE